MHTGVDVTLPAVGYEHAFALAVQLEVLRIHKVTSEYGLVTADAVPGQHVVVIEIFDDDASVLIAAETVAATVAFIQGRSKMSREHRAVTSHVIGENDQPASTAKILVKHGRANDSGARARSLQYNQLPARRRMLHVAADKRKPKACALKREQQCSLSGRGCGSSQAFRRVARCSR
jgi:hypothetical protein